MFMKEQELVNTITEEGIEKMKLLAGQSISICQINLKSLSDLFDSEVIESNSVYFGLASVYEMGRIDGIRQEREKRNQKLNSSNKKVIKEVQFTILQNSDEKVAI